MFREIRKSERITDEDRRRLEEEERKHRAFLNIKPETDITIEETKDFWNQMFGA